jgi:hypothetical protein
MVNYYILENAGKACTVVLRGANEFMLGKFGALSN